MESKVMRSVEYSGYGGGVSSLKHVEVGIPVVKAKDVLVKVEATSLNALDKNIQLGKFRPFLPQKFPYTPGSDVCGEVVEVGAGVTKLKVGDKVVAWLELAAQNGVDIITLSITPNRQPPGVATFFNPIDMALLSAVKVGIFVVRATGNTGPAPTSISSFNPRIFTVGAAAHDRAGGGLAEYAVAREHMVAVRPPGVSAAQAAGLPIAAVTAHQALTKDCGLKLDGTDAKTNILVTAASGGVGHYAVQLAKLANAHVTATCGARNIELVKSLGADEILDYRTEEGAALKSPSGKKYDYVIHCATGTSWSTFEPNLAAASRVVDLTPGVAALWRHAVNKITLSKKRLVPFIFMKVTAEKLEFLGNLVKENKLKTHISSIYPLTQVEDAWEGIISGHAVGKIIVEP